MRHGNPLRNGLLRAWKPGDEVSLTRNADNPGIARNLRDHFPNPYTVADGVAYIERVSDQDPVLSFAITVEGEAVGGISIHPGTDVYRFSGEMGYWLGEPYWGRGIASEAAMAVTEYGFRYLGLNRVFAIVFEGNEASMRVLVKCSFELEGRRRRSAVKGGRVLDEFVFARIREDLA